MQPGIFGVSTARQTDKNKSLRQTPASGKFQTHVRSEYRILSHDFRGAVALVTGSGRGLGRVIAETLLAGGASVALHDLNEQAPAQYGESPSLTALAQSLSQTGGKSVAVTGDITSESQIAAMVQKAQSALGPISILVNCAGGDIGAAGGKPSPNGALDISLEDTMAVMNRNFLGTMLMCRAVVPGMAERQNGSVINFGSLNGHVGVSPEVVYGCAKAAVIHYTRCLALEMRPHGVRVNAISPGPTTTARFLATRQTDPDKMEGVSLERYAKPSEIANAVAFLASAQSGFVSGQVLRVDGGMTLFAA
jgi:NAD(P)-dependent dehydrogenase (short-subunit alcohol dehydrogenase family)